jgi:uncharacterized protein YceK
MKKILLVILALAALSGCASAPSEYNQGCRDGIVGFNQLSGEKSVDKYCDDLDRTHRDRLDPKAAYRR